MNSYNKRIFVVLILIVVVIICLLGLILLKNISIANESNEKIEKIIQEINWPIDDVPIYFEEGLIFEKISDTNWSISLEKGVDYDEFRSYLLKLESNDFEADKSVGSKSPRLLHQVLYENSVKDVFWQGNKNDYTIRVYWAMEGANDEFNIPYDYNFNIVLSKKISITQNDDIVSGDKIEEKIDEVPQENLDETSEENF